MAEYKAEHLIVPTAEDMAEILNLWKQIPGRTCSAASYLDYLDTYWSEVALFVIRRDGVIVSFTQAEAPSILDPKTAWLPFSYCSSGCTKECRREAVRLAETWMAGKGASRWKMSTVRKPEALKRLWGLRPDKEVLMVKELTDDA